MTPPPTSHAAPSTPLDPYVISLIRTITPAAWGHLAAWLISLGISPATLDPGRAVLAECLAFLLTAGWYALWRWIEIKVPAADHAVAYVLAIIALGHPAMPSYPTASTPAHQISSPQA
jgi:hypothetical protein